METCELGAFLEGQQTRLRQTIADLAKRYDYVSVLGTDSSGVSFRVSPQERRVGDSMWSERGFVFRVQQAGRIVEFALNVLPKGDLAATISAQIDQLLSAGPDARLYPALPDEAAEASRFATVAENPLAADPAKVMDRLALARAALMQQSPEIVFSSANAEFVRVRKIFLSPKRDLAQAYFWGQGYLITVAKRGDETRENYQPFSGYMGLELLDELDSKVEALATETIELLSAEKPLPGEYDVICDPDVTGLIAHEAFGHGVEMDMFVKGRAQAPEYLGKAVASPIVDMYDTAAGIEQCGSYLFDDEGTFASSTKIIDKGILVAGLSDLQSAASLGTKPTGNGRREAFDHKAYARMTNTYIAPGKDSLEDMIASIKHGYLLQKMSSGMEDPKNWGIQLVLTVGREIVDGKLSGRMVSPIVCSGYVPELLSSISMISGTVELGGSGACGKGYKEYAKVSSGGPYIKARMRLG
ncbi:MAG: TldD/PmbA family protein [Spirochaetes bacterium]|nr:TldD/PmbA family protein [Spirochaetota bacterium]MBU0955183.1 TldD/PmbA family protein [Spirochaetota bacterium]